MPVRMIARLAAACDAAGRWPPACRPGARWCALQGWRARPAAWRRQHGCCRV